MRLCTFEHAATREVGILRDGKILPVSQVNAKRGADFPLEMLALIESGTAPALDALAKDLSAEIPIAETVLRIPSALFHE